MNQTSPLAHLRVIVVGLGSIGHRHLENLARLGVPHRAVLRRSQGNPAFQVPPQVRLFHRVEDALSAGFDAAIVCTPTALHAETALPWIEHGVPVLLEKPIDSSPEQAQRLLHAEQKHRPGSWMAYCMRYHPAWRLVWEKLHSGQLPPVEYFKVWYEGDVTTWHPWEDYRQSYVARPELGGGVLPTLDHEVDLLLWCFGKPRGVQGRTFATRWLQLPVPDTCFSLWHYAGGPQGVLSLSLARRDRTRGFELVTAEGTLRGDLMAGAVDWLPPGAQQQPELRRRWWYDPQYDWNRMYLELLRAFLASVVGTREVEVPLRAGWEALQVCRAVLGAS